jgi:hypothetical protein
MINLIKEIASQEILPFENIKKNGYRQIKEFEIDCTHLDDYNHIDPRKVGPYVPMFKDIMEMKGPVLYFFEVLSDTSPSEIIESIKSFSNGPNSKSIPAIKKTIPISKILYVGKVKKIFWGRVIQHLGFYKVRGTQGLQLYYWAKPLNLKLKLTAIEFEDDASEIISILEKKFAQQLNPILGKHK